jgi:hypothetical protein
MVIFLKISMITVIITVLTAILGIFLDWKQKYIKMLLTTGIICLIILLTIVIAFLKV